MALTARTVRQPAPLNWLVFADAVTQGALATALGSSGERLIAARTSDAFRTGLHGLGADGSVIVIGAPPAQPDDLAAAAEARLARPGRRLLLLTEPVDVAARLASLERGFDDALPRTIQPDELVARARILAARRPVVVPAGRSGPMRRREVPLTGDARLDPIARRVRRDGADIHLRPKELALLLVFATHPGRAFSRGDLLDRVWGEGFRGDPRTVDVHVRWLRAKLEPDPPRPVHFRTVRGHGYRFDPPGPTPLIDS